MIVCVNYVSQTYKKKKCVPLKQKKKRKLINEMYTIARVNHIIFMRLPVWWVVQIFFGFAIVI